MRQAETMTIQEKLAISMKAIEQKNLGNMEEYYRITRSIPMSPYLAKFAKDHFGADFLIQSGWNLSEAEAEYGSDWLSR
jgi:hypothetical protein